MKAKLLRIAASAAASALLSLPAMATTSWSFGSGAANNNLADGAFAATNSTVSGVTGVATGTLQAASAVAYSGGLGVSYTGETTTSPQHAIDNNVRTESILFDFSTLGTVALNSITIGWKNTDADVSILAYTGIGGSMTDPTSLAGKTYSGLLSSGWQVVANKANLAVGTAATFNTGVTPVSSSYWLVSAYNSVFGSCSGCTNNNDYFKLSGLAGDVTPPKKVPEPSSMALLGVSLLGVMALRRRQKSDAS